MIGKFNRRITVKTWATSKDAGGGVSAQGVSNSYDIWANVENRTGRIITGQNQEQWSYDYKITCRHEVSRPILSNQTISYQNKSLTINSIAYQDEGNKRFAIIRCSVTTT